MIGVTTTIEFNKLPQIAARFPRVVDRLIDEEVIAFEGGAKANVVSMDVIDTGNLLNAIHGDTGADEVSDGTDYGIHTNFGTVFVPPRPWWSNEIDKSRTRFPERFRDIERAL